METSLHRQLKDVYADSADQLEARLGDFRIDVLSSNELIEIQHGSLAAIRRKVARLREEHRVLVVKPIVVRKQLVKQDAKGGQVVGRRLSPKKGSILDLFDELVYFTRVFPHPNVRLEVPLVDVEEWRYPGHGRRRRRRSRDHQIEDQKLVRIHRVHGFSTAADLAELLPRSVSAAFDTAELAQAMDVARWTAQRITYCLRHMGAIEQVGKQGNARLYRRCA